MTFNAAAFLVLAGVLIAAARLLVQWRGRARIKAMTTSRYAFTIAIPVA